MIKQQTYKLDNLLLTNQILESYINKFWEDIFTPIKDSGEKHLMVLCKVHFSEGYKTLGELRRVNYSDKELFTEYLIRRLGLIIESYTPSDVISKISFSYVIKSGLASGNRMLLQDLTDKSVTTHRFNNLKLPISMNPADYGNIILNNIVEVVNSTVNRFIVESATRSYVIDVSEDGLVNKVRIQGAADLSWVDTKISDEIFKREIGKSIIYFMGGERVLRKKLLNAKPFTKVNVDSAINLDFVTMDIETITINNKLSPYLICAYNGTNKIHSYGEIVNGIINQKALFS